MKRCIVTFLHGDGLIAAALLLRETKAAEVRVSSAARIGRSIAELVEGRPSEVYICGLGIYCPVEEVLAGLRRLKRNQARITWYCGYDYLDEFAPALKRYVRLMCDHSNRPIHKVVFDALKAPDEHSERLLLLNKAKKDDKESRFLYDLADASMLAFLKFQDYDAVPNAIRKMAFPETVTERDRLLVQRLASAEACYLAGKTRTMQAMIKMIQKVGADRNCRVLILGETGTGKEVVARLIHESSPRHDQPFFAVSCANFTESLLESQLFGHEKGAFTGAESRQPGVFEMADGGTLFLDEVGEMPLNLQAKLLRALETGRFRRVGGTDELTVDVRVISATNKNLLEEVQSRGFRADLYYRLDTITIHAPALRDIPDDIPRIAQDLIYRLSHARRILPWKLTKKEIQALRSHSWPGNVRELQNVIERAIVLEQRDFVKLLGARQTSDVESYLPRERAGPAEIRPLHEVELVLRSEALLLRRVVHEHIMRVYESTGRNKTQTAKLLGISVNTLKKHCRYRTGLCGR